jgi:hypothetical protein
MTGTELSDVEKSLEGIPHPSLLEGSSIAGGTKVFPDLQAENGETSFMLGHGIAHESSVSVVATTGTDAGLAVASVDVDVDDALDAARRSMGHLRDRRPASYAELPVPARAG